MFCKNCGAKIADDSIFCSSCGTKVVQQENNNTKEDIPVNKQTIGIVCKQCGSGDATKIDEYTYKCNMCGTIISLPRPDTKITNINSFTNSVDDIPVFQVKSNLPKDEFIRKCVLKIAKDESISPAFIKDLSIHTDDVETAYITYAEVKYSSFVNFSCSIRTVEGYVDSNGNSRGSVRHTPIVSSSNDSGIELICAFGSETTLNFVRPIYVIDKLCEFIPFTENEKFPLKKRIDRSAEEKLSNKKVDELANNSYANLPKRGTIENWKYSGQCKIDKIDTLHYVPCYNVTSSSNGKRVLFASTAVGNGNIYPQYLFDKKLVIVSDTVKPSYSRASKELKEHKALNLISLFSCIFGYIFAGVSLTLAPFFGALCLLGIPFGLAAGIAGNAIRKKCVKIIKNNQDYDYQNDRLNACIKCLSQNNLPELSKVEHDSFVKPGLTRKRIDEKGKIIVMAILLGLSAVTSISFCSYSVVNKMKAISNVAKNTVTLTYTGKGQVQGMGEYVPGTKVTITATPSYGYVFSYWIQGGKVVSTSQTYTFTMPDYDVSFGAKFTYIS